MSGPFTGLRAAIAGSGFIGRVHADTLRRLGVEVAAISSRTREGAAKLVAELGGGTAYDSVAELLAAERVDVLHVCSPNSAHAEQALAALGQGVHVICEKPLAVSTDEALRMVDAVSESGLVGATCYHVRGYPLVEEMRALVAGGDLGEVLLVHGRYACDDALHPASGWRLQREASGPSYVVGDLGTHWLDAVEHVTGLRVEAVLAEFRTHDEQRTDLEETALLLLRLGGSCAGTAVFTAVTAGRKNQLLLECEGLRGGLTWDQERPDELLRRHADRPTELVLKDAPAARRLAHFPAGHAEGYGEAFANILEAAYRAIAGEPNDGYATFEDGYRGVALVEAAVASAASGDWVEPRSL